MHCRSCGVKIKGKPYAVDKHGEYCDSVCERIKLTEQMARDSQRSRLCLAARVVRFGRNYDDIEYDEGPEENKRIDQLNPGYGKGVAI